MRLLLGEYPELGSYDLELGLPTQEFVGSKEEKGFLIWLATLCALRHKNPAGLEAWASSSEDTSSFHDGGWNSSGITDIKKTIRMTGGYEEQTKSVSLQDIAWLYYGVKDLDLIKIARHRFV